MKLCPNCQRCYEDAENYCALDAAALVPARPGSRLIADKYLLERMLGRGGVGAVYAGKHIELDRDVAIKLMLPDFMPDEEACERFRREARAAARLHHPNVAQVHDYGTLANGEAYIVMELVEGQTLRDFMRGGSMTIDDTVTIAAQVAEGVEAAHRRGIIHRDLKPSNIILTRDHYDRRQAKVVDFGIAKMKETTSGNFPLTNSGSLIGTPRYMSPEQSGAKDLDNRSDIYSLGVILYEMLAGRPPFEAHTPTAVALKHIQEEPRPVSELRPDIPPALAALVMQMLKKSPDERPASAAAVAERLHTLTDYPVAQHINTGFNGRPDAATLINEPREQTASTVVKRPATKVDTITSELSPATRRHRPLVYGGIALAFMASAALLWLFLSAPAPTPQQAQQQTEQQPAPSAPATAPIEPPQTTPRTENRRAVHRETTTGSSSDTSAELKGALDQWIATTNARDLERQKQMYAREVENFYLARKVPRKSVLAEKARVFGSAQRVDVEAGEPEISVSPDGRTATMLFRKRYNIDGGAGSREGEVLQELRWKRTKKGWRIIGERDVQVIR